MGYCQAVPVGDSALAHQASGTRPFAPCHARSPLKDVVQALGAAAELQAVVVHLLLLLLLLLLSLLLLLEYASELLFVVSECSQCDFQQLCCCT
jgi:hypothetical protein